MPVIPKVLAPTSPAGNLVRSFDGITYAAFTPTTGPTGFRNLFLPGGNVIYALDQAGQIWQSLDFGQNWTALGIAAPNAPTGTNCFFITPLGTFLIVASVAGDTAQIQRSTNRGVSWTTIRPFGVSADNFFIRTFFSRSDGIYFGADDNTNTARSGLWRSQDDGQTWTQDGATASGATQGCQVFRNAFFVPFSSLLSRFIPFVSVTQFNYAPSTNPDAGGAQVTRGDGGGAFLMRGTDGITRSWSTGADEFHATDANVDANSWTAGPAAVANGPSYGGVVVKGDIFFGANVALAHYVLSQNHGTSWTDTGIAIGLGTLAIAVFPDPAGLNRKLRGGIPGGIRLPRGLPQGPVVTIEEPG